VAHKDDQWQQCFSVAPLLYVYRVCVFSGTTKIRITLKELVETEQVSYKGEKSFEQLKVVS
jgi:hypothetical protein